MAIEKNIVIGADMSGLEKKLDELIDLLKDTQKQADKTSNSIEDISEEVSDIGTSAKDAKKGVDGLSSGFKGLGLSIKAAGIGLLIEGFQLFKDVAGSNQGIADAFAVTLQTLIFAFNGIIGAIQNRSWSQFASALTESYENAKQIVELQKAAQLADAKRNKTQLEYQLMAERARQLRDDETRSIDTRIEANELLNGILVDQINLEKSYAEQQLELAKLEFARNANQENRLALIQAETELIDIQERIAGQQSEYEMNRNALAREARDIESSRAETAIEVWRIQKQASIDILENERIRIEETSRLEEEAWISQIQRLEGLRMKMLENTAEYQDIQSQIETLNAEFYAGQMTREAELARLRRDNIQENFDLTAEGFSAIMALNDAFAKDDEESAKKAFETNKALQTAQAVINTAQAVTAQLAVPQDALTGQNFVKAGIALATGIAQIRTIQSTQFGGGSTALGTTISEPQSPQFNIVGSTGANAILESLRNNPVRAYVVSGDVTTAQELDRRRVNQVSFP